MVVLLVLWVRSVLLHLVVVMILVLVLLVLVLCGAAGQRGLSLLVVHGGRLCDWSGGAEHQPTDEKGATVGDGDGRKRNGRWEEEGRRRRRQHQRAREALAVML